MFRSICTFAGWSLVAAFPAAAVAQPSAARITVAWQAVPLAEAVASINQAAGGALFLDRRIDPTQRIDLMLADASISEAADFLAALVGAATAKTSSVIYVGPASTAERLPTLAAQALAQAERAPARPRQSLLRSTPMKWELLDEPARTISEAASRSRVELLDADHIPHDLWRAGQLPATPLVEQLTILLAGFDLTAVVEPSGAVRVVPMPEEVAIERRFPLPSTSPRTLNAWRDEAPGLDLRIEGQELVAAGRKEDLESFADLLERRPTNSPTRPARPGRVEVQARVRAVDRPVGELLEELASRLQLTLRIADEVRNAGLDLNQPVSVDVAGVSLDELFAAVLADTGLTHEVRPGELVIRRAD